MDYLLYFFDIEQPRKQAVVRQILNNRKTSSSLYWGLRYQILDYLNLTSKLNVEHFNKAIYELIENKLLIEKSNGLILSSKGQQRLEKMKNEHYFYQHPENFQQLDYNLWSSLMLLSIQVVSEYLHNNNQYYVVSNNLQAQFLTKKWLHKFGFNELCIELKLYLSDFLNEIEPKLADIFANKLTGNGLTALSNRQISRFYSLNELDIEIIFRDLALQFAMYLKKKNAKLSLLVETAQLQGINSETVMKTKKLFDQGLAFYQIQQARKLKSSTINDHLQILAITDKNFAFNKIFNDEEIKLLDQVYTGNIDEWRYEKIATIDPNFPFFKFRMFCIMRTHDEQQSK